MTSDPLPLIIEPETLQALLPDDDLILVAVCSAQIYNSGHLPGSLLIEPAELVSGIKPATGKIPSADRLSALCSRIGLTADKQVVAYDDEGGGWAGRLIWTLDVLGHQKSSYLNGGLIAWARAGFALDDQIPSVVATEFTAHIDHGQIAQQADVLQQIGSDNTVVWDARAKQEYDGVKVTALRNGHIPGAVNLDWLDLMDRDNDLRLKPLTEISQTLESMGVSKDKTIITHCQTHHRSGLTYLVGKALGLNIKAYDGSWSEWGNADDTPIETSANP